MKKIMAIDFSAICYGLMHSLGNVDLSHKGEPTGIIYGFMQQLHFLYRTIKPTCTVILCDSKHSKRSKIYPEYKEKRKKQKNDSYKEDPKALQMYLDTKKQVHAMRRVILPKLGFKNVFMQPGYEADDIFATIQKAYSQSELIMVSRDKDLLQLLNRNTSMFDPNKKFYTRVADFKKEYGFDPSKWGMCKQICGCTTDDVEGIKGVGDKPPNGRGLQYMRGDLAKGIVYERIISPEGQAIIQRNKDLVVLPFPGTKSFKLRPNEFNKAEFKKLCKRFDFQSILYTIDDWNIM